MSGPHSLARFRARITGTVQGVGFRPYLFRLAESLDLAGFVFNDARGVVVEVEGEPGAIDTFFERMAAQLPPLASIESVSRESVPSAGTRGFQILDSAASGAMYTFVAPDTATCAECLSEIFDGANRRFRYPFTNCTNCGPRFTIVTGGPYDRRLTSMAPFQMCGECQQEFDEPSNRRFHAQPNACGVCGPAVLLLSSSGEPVRTAANDAIGAAAQLLCEGAIVAIKGLGGYHLACRADSEAAAGALRARKHREEKPFAVMVPDIEGARALVQLQEGDETLLTSRERPIVLAPRRSDAAVAASVAPISRELGVMLPYTPLHHLLLADAKVALVMTSGNVSDEPIAYRDADASERLASIAGYFLTHNRQIVTRTDDSVVRGGDDHGRYATQILRRSRGYVPAALKLPVHTRPLLACGAELKSTFCVAKGDDAWLSHHIGDLKNFETLRSYREGIDHFEDLFSVRSEIVAHDLHPDYLSTAYALEREGIELVGVQHHHAHFAACLAEYGITEPAIGAIFDGSGYGSDGTAWGGEFLVGDLGTFERRGHLWPVRMPGGDGVIKEPWRMACSWLAEAMDTEPQLPANLRGLVDEKKWAAVARLAITGVSSPLTSSVGRLFDAVAALAGVCITATYEGQPAVELDAAAEDTGDDELIEFPIFESAHTAEHPSSLIVDPRGAILQIARDSQAGVSGGIISRRFHSALARATASVCASIAERSGIRIVALSGGVFQNHRLLEHTQRLLTQRGLRVLTPRLVPPNDGGIAYGQAAVAAWRCR